MYYVGNPLFLTKFITYFHNSYHHISEIISELSLTQKRVALLTDKCCAVGCDVMRPGMGMHLNSNLEIRQLACLGGAPIEFG